MKLFIAGELEYDDSLMHGDDPEAKQWFRNVLKGKLVVHENEEIGDEIGTLKITKLLDNKILGE